MNEKRRHPLVDCPVLYSRVGTPKTNEPADAIIEWVEYHREEEDERGLKGIYVARVVNGEITPMHMYSYKSQHDYDDFLVSARNSIADGIDHPYEAERTPTWVDVYRI